MKHKQKVFLILLCLLMAFVLRSGGQERLTAKEQSRMERMFRETPMVQIAGNVNGGEVLSVLHQAGQSPKAKAFVLVAYVSPTFAFASVPTYVNVEDGEYRASGKCQWEGQAAVWSLTIRSLKTQTPMPALSDIMAARMYLSVLLWRDRKIVFERGKPRKLIAVECSQMPIILPPPITQEPLR